MAIIPITEARKIQNTLPEADEVALAIYKQKGEACTDYISEKIKQTALTKGTGITLDETDFAKIFGEDKGSYGENDMVFDNLRTDSDRRGAQSATALINRVMKEYYHPERLKLSWLKMLPESTKAINKLVSLVENDFQQAGYQCATSDTIISVYGYACRWRLEISWFTVDDYVQTD
ncbi:hypothetical protein GPK34_00280 [Secundilactobacillus kimchicus]|uniref:hypothetical protein n=1 Tax=Secundilactobacillus kimchicus TaxID=528209 RepID=UPI001C02B42E|nr:hypothetical protein [Secundilactobacillus kimchicus]MBT9670473.1 hypothetical protein [Secundilactobacillus kimchicus]